MRSYWAGNVPDDMNLQTCSRFWSSIKTESEGKSVDWWGQERWRPGTVLIDWSLPILGKVFKSLKFYRSGKSARVGISLFQWNDRNNIGYLDIRVNVKRNFQLKLWCCGRKWFSFSVALYFCPDIQRALAWKPTYLIWFQGVSSKKV